VGGFYRAPSKETLDALLPELEWALDFAQQAVERLSAIAFPAFERDYVFMALRHSDEYAIAEGNLATSDGVAAPVRDYDSLLEERHEAHSTALRSYRPDGGMVHLGPLARFALNRDRLTPLAMACANRINLPSAVRNPFQSILVRGVEVVLALEESIRLIRCYQTPAASSIAISPPAGTGYGATEAPRGICYHRYTLDDAGLITQAKIVAPTSVNQRVIEADLYHHIAGCMDLPDDALRARCELAIRNYDPCISCSTHFLNLTVNRT
jgi:coenzyme F420-reducing hydrogenase alpha subunit